MTKRVSDRNPATKRAKPRAARSPDKKRAKPSSARNAEKERKPDSAPNAEKRTKPAARNPALEAAIASDPTNADAYLVYADWLQAQGDPRGDLIALQVARHTKHKDKKLANAEATWFRDHADHAFGPLAWHKARGKHRWSPNLELDWRFGFIRTAHITANNNVSPSDLPELLAQFLALPVAGLVESLALGQVFADPSMAHYPPVIETLVAQRAHLPALRTLRFGAIIDWNVSWGTIGDLRALLKAFPSLERLELRGGDIRLGKPSHSLRELSIETDSSIDAICPSLEAAKLPALERLTLIMGPNTGEIDRLKTVFDGRFPALRHLQLEWVDPTRPQIERLCTGQTLPKLETLSLASCALTDTKAAVIAPHAMHFAHLASIDLDNNLLSAKGRKLLASLCKDVRFGEQQDYDDLYEWT